MRKTLFSSDAHLTHLCDICICTLVPLHCFLSASLVVAEDGPEAVHLVMAASRLLEWCTGSEARPTYSGFSDGEDKASRYHVEHWARKCVCQRAKHASRVNRYGCREMNHRSVMVQYVSTRLDIIVTCLLL